jgi:hypothetical protein
MYVAPCAAPSRDLKSAPGRRAVAPQLEDYLHWLEAERQCGCTESSLTKYLSHVRGLLDYAWRSGRTERNVLDGFNLQHTVPRAEPRSLSLEEAERLVKATEAPGRQHGAIAREASEVMIGETRYEELQLAFRTSAPKPVRACQPTSTIPSSS